MEHPAAPSPDLEDSFSLEFHFITVLPIQYHQSSLWFRMLFQETDLAGNGFLNEEVWPEETGMNLEAIGEEMINNQPVKNSQLKSCKIST